MPRRSGRSRSIKLGSHRPADKFVQVVLHDALRSLTLSPAATFLRPHGRVGNRLRGNPLTQTVGPSRIYWSTVRLKEWLFPGDQSGDPMSRFAIEYTRRNARERSGIRQVSSAASALRTVDRCLLHITAPHWRSSTALVRRFRTDVRWASGETRARSPSPAGWPASCSCAMIRVTCTVHETSTALESGLRQPAVVMTHCVAVAEITTRLFALSVPLRSR
jgi:hypothetical protein